MATSQAVNLGGMLNQIGGSLREGFTIDGQQVGDALGKTVTNAMAPSVDMADAASLRRFAEYARRAGKDDVAVQYEERAARLEQQERAAKANTAVARQYTMGNRSVQDGDVAGVDSSIAKLQNQLSKQTDPQAQENILRAIDQLNQSRGAAMDAQQRNKLAGAVNIDRLLEQGNLDGQQRAALEQTRERLLSDPTISNAYEEQRFEVAKRQREEDAMRFEAEVLPQVNNKIRAAGNDTERLNEIVEQYPNYASQVQQLVAERVQFMDGMQKYRDAAAERTGTYDLGSLESQIDELPEEFQAAARQNLERVKQLQDKNVVNGTWVGPRSEADKAYNRLLDTMDQAQLESSSMALRTNNAKRVEEDNYIESIEREAAKGLSDQDAALYVTRLYGDDIPEGQMEEYIEEAKETYSQDLMNYKQREELRFALERNPDADPVDYIGEPSQEDLKEGWSQGFTREELFEMMIEVGYTEKNALDAWTKFVRSGVKGAKAAEAASDAAAAAEVVRRKDQALAYSVNPALSGTLRGNTPMPDRSEQQARVRQQDRDSLEYIRRNNSPPIGPNMGGMFN